MSTWWIRGAFERVSMGVRRV